MARQVEGGDVPLEATCPACGGIGWVRSQAGLGDKDFGKLFRCPICSEEERRRYLAKMCGLEGVLMDVRFADWRGGNWPDVDPIEREIRIQQRRVAWKAIDAALDERTGLFTFWGDFGSGKTHALAVVVNECRDGLIESHYTPFASILDHLRSLYGQRRDTSDYWQRLLDVPVLAVDEVTRFNDTGWAREKLHVLVDTRYRRRQSHLTLFATNDDPRQSLATAEALGYLYSRMREGMMVELRGDMRSAVASKAGEWWD